MEITSGYGKMYLPSEYINSNWSYNLDNQYIQVRTNNNCYTQYTTTYCDCFRIYPNYNYVRSDTYACSYSSSFSTSYSSFSSDIFDLPNLSNYFIVYFIIIFILIYILNKLWCAFRKRLY